MTTWRTDEPPKDGSQFLADIGLPWGVVAAWNGCYERYVYASLQRGRVNCIYNDTWFENWNSQTIKRWMPMPELSK